VSDPANFTGGYRVQVASRVSGGNVTTTTDATTFRVRFLVDSIAPVFIYFTTTSGAHPNSTGALNFGLDYADAIYNAIKSL